VVSTVALDLVFHQAAVEAIARRALLALAAVLDMVAEPLTALDQALHCQLQSRLLEKQLQFNFEVASMSPRPDGPSWTTVELVLWVAILSVP
jgi:hypothetical protein